MQYKNLIQNIPNVTVTAYGGSFLITVPDSNAAATVLDRVIKDKARCWIGIHPQQPEEELSIYAAYPIQMWIATVSAQSARP